MGCFPPVAKGKREYGARGLKNKTNSAELLIGLNLDFSTDAHEPHLPTANKVKFELCLEGG